MKSDLLKIEQLPLDRATFIRKQLFKALKDNY